MRVQHRGVVDRGHPVAAQQVQLPADHPRHRHPGGDRRPAAAARPARGRPFRRRLRIASEQVCSLPTASTAMAPATGQARRPGPGRPGTVRQQRVPRRRAPRPGREPPGSGPRRPLAPPPGPRDHHGAEPDPARAHHRHPLVRAHPGLGRPARGTPWRTGTRAAPSQVDPAGSATRLVSAAWRTTSSAKDPSGVNPRAAPLVRADLGIAGEAPRAATAPADERDRHPVTDPPPRDAGAHLDDHAGRARGRARGGKTMSSSCPAQPCQSLRHRPVAITRTTTPRDGADGDDLADLRHCSDRIDDHGAHPPILPPGSPHEHPRLPHRPARRHRRDARRAHRRKPALLVNVASKCGLTPQYTGLEELQETYAERGFTVIGLPCNQFMGQEPGRRRGDPGVLLRDVRRDLPDDGEDRGQRRRPPRDLPGPGRDPQREGRDRRRAVELREVPRRRLAARSSPASAPASSPRTRRSSAPSRPSG